MIFGSDAIVLAMFGMIAVVARQGTPPRSVDRSGLTYPTVKVLPQVICVSLSRFISAFTAR